jgi:hypothetical protein
MQGSLSGLMEIYFNVSLPIMLVSLTNELDTLPVNKIRSEGCCSSHQRGWTQFHINTMISSLRTIEILGCCGRLKRSPGLQSGRNTRDIRVSIDRLDQSIR